jgi:hypothetical protein
MAFSRNVYKTLCLAFRMTGASMTALQPLRLVLDALDHEPAAG